MPKPKSTICLNMIVKNESHIIEDTLNNLCSKINFDYWVICDTGSTDNTKEIIQAFFDNKNIKGELHTNEWVDFAHNRTVALEKAYNKTDYLLIFDADDEIVGNLVLPENLLEYDSYLLQFDGYERTLLINNRKKWKFYGVLHEYIGCLEDFTQFSLCGDYYLISGRKGNRSKNPNKYLDDAIKLEKAYEAAKHDNDNIHMRYSFYCANSYKDAGDIVNAIKWYKNTLQLNNWNQEKYVCCLNLFELYEKLNDVELGIYYLIESHTYDCERVECAYNLIKHYCCKQNYKMAYVFYELVQNYYENKYINDNFSGKLFINNSISSFFLPYYMIIVCDRLQKYDVGLKMFNIIFIKKYIDVGEWWINNLVFNLQFFIDKIQDISFVNNWRTYASLLTNRFTIDKTLVDKYETQFASKFIEINLFSFL